MFVFMNNTKKTFWSINKTKNGIDISFNKEELLDFISSELGFYRDDRYKLIRLTRGSILEEARIEDIKRDIKFYLRQTVKEEQVWSEFIKRNDINEQFIQFLDILPHVNYNPSSKDMALFNYQNGVVHIGKESCGLVPYEEYKGYVWKESINKRNFINKKINLDDVDFYKFLQNISGGDELRFKYLFSILGYLLHPYKDKSHAKAIIFIDEDFDLGSSANGGTGKSLLANALGKISPLLYKDAKRYNANQVFVYDDVRKYHRLLYFDDVRNGFNLEEFYSFITGELKVNRKYQDSVSIPFEVAPKLLISSNYLVDGTFGDTDFRRRLEFEFAPYYSKDNTPSMEFGYNFFDDWDDEQWNMFDILMLRSVHYYMNNGLRPQYSENYGQKKISILTSKNFVEFMDNNFIESGKYDKAELLASFKMAFDNPHLSAIKFKQWIDIYAEYNNLSIKHYKGSGKAKVSLQL